jgi:hypothetical protein
VELSRSLARAAGLVATALALLAAAGCGNGGGLTTVRTNGRFSAATVNGTYVYEIHGDSLNGEYTEVGAFTADGTGNVTAGSDDSNLNAGGLATSFTGNYSVAADGTGFVTFSNTALGQITFALTIVSSSEIDLMEADFFAFGTGKAQLQVASAAPNTPNGTFVFRLHEQASVQSSSSFAAEVGAFAISGGAITAGTRMDQNLGGVSSQLTINGGTFNAPGSLGRGTATLTDSSNSTRNLIYYIVDNRKLVLLVSNANAIGSGSAELQTGAVSAGLSGNYAFGSSGDDGVFFDATATVGSFTASSGTITPYSFDAMQDGTYSQGSDSGTYTAGANGRVAATLNTGSPEVFWMVNPSRAFFLINASGKVEDGTADLQTVSSFSAATMNDQYAMVMHGDDFVNVADLARIGPLLFDGTSKLSLLELVNNSATGAGAQSPAGGGLVGNYQVSPNGRITGSLNNSSGGLSVAMYAISGSSGYILQADGGTTTSGTFDLQH